MKIILNLLRVNQWYKNLVIYLALVFSNMLFYPGEFFLTTLGLISLCLISSTSYIINDILDIKKDKEHPEKRLRPIPSGKISIFSAGITAIISGVVSFLLAYKISTVFLVSVFALFTLTLLYSLYLKNILFLDIITVSTNFSIRAISGTFIIGRALSPWLILCPFFLALFLVVGKRQADLEILGEKAYKHKEVLRYYTPKINNVLLIISTTILIICYSLFAVLGDHKKLLLTLPFAVYAIFRYLFLVYTGSEIARTPQLFYKDKQLTTGIILWVIVVLLSLYINFSTYQIIYPSLSS